MIIPGYWLIALDCTVMTVLYCIAHYSCTYDRIIFIMSWYRYIALIGTWVQCLLTYHDMFANKRAFHVLVQAKELINELSLKCAVFLPRGGSLKYSGATHACNQLPKMDPEWRNQCWCIRYPKWRDSMHFKP